MAGGAQDLSELEKDPRLFLYTSLTAGSSHIITATSRLETILKANKIPFQAIDTATDEKARRLWQRRAGKRKIPGLVKEGFVLGDLEEVEEWNEFGELHENIGPVPPAGPTATAPNQNQKPTVSPTPPLPVNPTASGGTAKISPAKPLVDESKMRPLPGAAEIAARNNPLPKSSPEDAVKPETMGSAPAEKEKTINAAKAALGTESSKVDHMSAPPSAIQSGTQTPAELTQSSTEAYPATKEPMNAAKAAMGTESSKVDHMSAPPSAIQSGTQTPAEPAQPSTEAASATKEPMNAAKAALGTDSSKVDHLSAPPSAIQSGTQTPAEPAQGGETTSGATKEDQVPFSPAIADTAGERKSSTHRGSDVRPVPSEEIKKVEGENAITEDTEEDAAGVAKGVEGMQVGEGKDVQEQKAKEPEDAGKSVED